ncbi:hypothetical protein [uncultured Fibrella sp.]|uniref:hypothetical protein n=1 Tax=uncultured Fibrella sp. TaxID=1284596 RepID=UPI0035CA5DB0
MIFSIHIKTTIILLPLLILVQFVSAQSTVDNSDYSSVEYQNHNEYYERITYIGKRKDIFIVDTYLKDSTLYRVDNYKMLDQGLQFGIYAVRHGPSKLFYGDGKLYLSCDYNMNVLNGPFIVYYNDGAIKRRELYKNGNLKKSLCYDPEGHEQACEPFYQNVKFTGNPKELKTYLEKNLQTLFDGNQSMILTMGLTINEVGQVINVNMGVGRTNPRLVAAVRRVIQDMPRWHENESNWRPAYMDGVPVPGNWDIQAYRERSNYWRITFP